MTPEDLRLKFKKDLAEEEIAALVREARIDFAVFVGIVTLLAASVGLACVAIFYS